jgi:hypothetical protein
LLPTARGDYIAANAYQCFVFKFQNDAALLDDLALVPHLVEIIPAVTMKTVLDQRRAHNESHLGLGHTRTQLQHHFGCNDIALLDIHPVGFQ